MPYPNYSQERDENWASEPALADAFREPQCQLLLAINSILASNIWLIFIGFFMDSSVTPSRSALAQLALDNALQGTNKLTAADR